MPSKVADDYYYWVHVWGNHTKPHDFKKQCPAIWLPGGLTFFKCDKKRGHKGKHTATNPKKQVRWEVSWL